MNKWNIFQYEKRNFIFPSSHVISSRSSNVNIIFICEKINFAMVTWFVVLFVPKVKWFGMVWYGLVCLKNTVQLRYKQTVHMQCICCSSSLPLVQFVSEPVQHFMNQYKIFWTCTKCLKWVNLIFFVFVFVSNNEIILALRSSPA